MVHHLAIAAAKAVQAASAAPATPHTADSQDYVWALGAGALCVMVGFGVRVVMSRRLQAEVALKHNSEFNYGSSGGDESHTSHAYRQYPERWLMLGVYAFCMMTSTIMATALMSSQVPAIQLFSVKAYDIVTIMSVMTFLMLPGTIFSEVLFHRMGIKNTCVVGIMLTALAAWIMWFAAHTRSWPLEVSAVILAGLAGPLVGNACTALSGSWFSIDSRNFPTAVGSGGAGAIATALFNPNAVTQMGQLDFEMFLIATGASVSAFCFLFIYRETPPTPPSAEEPSAERTIRVDTWGALKAMVMDYNVLILLFCFALDGYGFGLILVTSVLQDIGYGQHEANLVMAAACIGSMSAMVIAPIADHLKQRDERWPVWLMQICQGLSFFCTLGLSLVLQPGMFTWILLCFFLIGVTTSAAAPFLLELIAEVTYPAPESLSAGVSLTVFGLATFGFVQLSQVMKDPIPKGQMGNEYNTFFWLQNLLFFLSVVLLTFVFKANLKRTDVNHAAKDDEEHDLLRGGSGKFKETF